MSILIASVFCVATVAGAHLNIAHYVMDTGHMISATAITSVDDFSANSDGDTVTAGKWTISYDSVGRQVHVNGKKISSRCK